MGIRRAEPSRGGDVTKDSVWQESVESRKSGFVLVFKNGAVF
jgi:hypothetical protein